MQRTIQIGLFSLLAALVWSCQSKSDGSAPPAPVIADLICSEPGLVQSLSIDDAQRGYPYIYNVYLPPCYETDSRNEYPVLYLVPGRGSGPTAWFDAGAATAADAAIQRDGVPPFIIVTTESTDNDPFAAEIVNELMPRIEANYPVRPGRAYHAVAGGSLGGIAAYRIAFQYPEAFASAALFGSGLVAGEERQFGDWLDALPRQDRPRVFLNSGEQDAYMLERAQVLKAILDEAGVESTLIAGQGGHDYRYWISNFPAYFAWLAQDW